MENGSLELPSDIKKFRKVIDQAEFRHSLYRCIACWYIETEIAIDIINRVRLYNVIDTSLNSNKVG